MMTKAQKVKMLWNGIVLFFAGGFITGTYMYAKQEVAETRTEDTCNEPCPDCVPKVPLTNLEEQ